MIHVNELRLSNLVYDDNGIDCKIISILPDCVLLDDCGEERAIYTKYLEHIPLTKEWLLKFGFQTDKITYWRGVDNPIQIGAFLSEFRMCWKGSLSQHLKRKIESVHHLQNLWYFTTGQELTLKGYFNHEHGSVF
jgi:hypothetical protein